MTGLRLLWLGLLAMLCVGVLPTAARGQDVQLNVSIGWDGNHRPGRWTPLFLTLSADEPRPVLVDVYSPHSGTQAMRMQQVVPVTTAPTTFIVYIIPNYEIEDLTVVLRDPRTGRRLAGYPDERQQTDPALLRGVYSREKLVGLTGAPGGAVGPVLTRANVAVGYLAPRRLPDVPIGYDAINLLVMNRLTITSITDAQQQAIADWVAGGGTLLVWFSDEAVPDHSPLLDILPATIGPNELVEIDPPRIAQAGLAERFAKMPARSLTPRAGATTTPLLGIDALQAVSGNHGYGRVVVYPVDLGLLTFADTAQTDAFWRGLNVLPLPDPTRAFDFTTLETNATSELANLLGDVPGAGVFDFSFVSITLIALMLLVGPIDWFVLRKLGHSPWTWATTLGWIGLFTTTAIYAGNLLSSGDLHDRSVSLITQVGDRVIDRTTVHCIASPRTRDYVLATDDGWWQPLPMGGWWGHRGVREDYAFRQSLDGNQPLPLRVPIWSMRLLVGKTDLGGEPLVQADLAVGADGVSGSVRNLSKHLLNNVCVTHAGQTWHLGTIDPGGTLEVAAPRTVSGLWSDPIFSKLEAMTTEDGTIALPAGSILLTATVLDVAPAVRIDVPNPIADHRTALRVLLPAARSNP
jgi:hypothetical protein